MASNAGRAPGLTPMNGTAGAGLSCGIFGIAIGIFLGFWSVPFALTAVIVGAAAIGISARGRAIAHLHGAESRIARAGLIVGAVAILLGLLGVIIR